MRLSKVTPVFKILGLTIAIAVSITPAHAEPQKVYGEKFVIEIDLDDLETREFLELPFTLQSVEGDAIDGAGIVIGGGMRAHGHGLPTAPQAEETSGGEYVIKGLKFSMAGNWELSFSVSHESGSEQLITEFLVN
ncbi:MAG: FixH family protein [Marivivens sp.]|jgi:hypothetical protein|nr:FixH family protein [Marivivens sp.]